MRVTQRDIAKRLNISQSLVAGVLGNRPGIWVSDRNRQRILQTAREMGYQPNAAARALRKGRTNVFVCVFFGQAGHQPIAEAMADALADAGCDLLVKVVHNCEQAHRRLSNLAFGSMCDAVALWGLEHHTESPAAQLASLGVPFVVKGRFEENHPEWPQIDFDHEGMMRQAVQHLACAGHHRIACIAYDNDLVYTRRLLQGYREAMQGLGAEMVGLVSSCFQDVWSLLDAWFSLPKAQQPTAAVNVVGQMAWEATELWLVRRCRKLGHEAGDLAMVGLSDGHSPLLFGDGLAYQDAELAHLARLIGSELLPAVANGKTPEPHVIRILPSLRPLSSRHLPLPQALPTS